MPFTRLPVDIAYIGGRLNLCCLICPRSVLIARLTTTAADFLLEVAIGDYGVTVDKLAAAVETVSKG